MSQTTEQAALQYADRFQWAILPVNRDKSPMTPHGFKDADVDEDRIQTWWKEYPNAQIGVACGDQSGGLVVIDLDNHAGQDITHLQKILEAECGPLPETLTATTGSGGKHLFFRTAAAVGCHTAWLGQTGVDVRANGGYVVVAPSTNERGTYRWNSDPFTTNIARLPETYEARLVTAVAAEPDKTQDTEADYQAESSVSALPARRADDVRIGERHLFLLKRACRLRYQQLTLDAIRKAILTENTHITVPLPVEEVNRIIARACALDPYSECFTLTHDGAAQRFVAQYGDDFRYCADVGRWYRWDGTRWTPDVKNRVLRAAVDCCEGIKDEVDGVEEYLKATYAAFAKSMSYLSAIKSMLEIARTVPELVLLADDFDKDPYLLNVVNGTIDLRTGRIREARREDYCMKRANAVAITEATCPIWEQFLVETFEGDGEMIAAVQRAVGYSFSGLTTYQGLFFPYGIGRNGKTTLLETLLNMIGDYGQKVPVEALVHRSGSAIPCDIARMQGARLAVASEIPEGSRLNEARVKELTGGERVTARYMRQDFFEFTPTIKLWVAGNYRPRISGTDDGIWRRLCLLPFDYQVPLNEVDPVLQEKLRAESAGILNWVLAGFAEYQRRIAVRGSDGIDWPEKVRAATCAWRAEEDVLGCFLTERTTWQPGGSGDSGETEFGLLITAFHDYLRQGGYDSHRWNKSAFASALDAKGIVSDRHGGRSWRKDITLTIQPAGAAPMEAAA